MSTYRIIAVILILLLLLVGPLCFFMFRYKLLKHFTFRNFWKVANHAGLVYLVIWAVLLLYVSVLTQPLVVASDFPAPDDEMVLFSIFVFYGMATVFYYMPFVLTVNATFFLWKRFLQQPSPGM